MLWRFARNYFYYYAFRRGKLLEIDKIQVELVAHFKSVPYLMKWVISYAHNRN